MNEHFEKIERYLRGLMPPAEAASFEAQMAADAELAAQVQQHRLERQGMELLVERDLFAKMAHWDRETELFRQVQPRQAKVRPMRWIMRAAAVLVVALAGYWYVEIYQPSETESTAPITSTKPEIKSRTPSVRRPKPTPPRQAAPAPETGQNEHLAQQDPAPSDPAPIEELAGPDYAALADEFYLERDFVPPKGSKGGQAGSAAYNQALDNFHSGKYNDAASRLKSTLNLGADAIQQKELLALSLYQSGQFEQAIPYFREVAASGKQPYAQRAQ